jgi:predicted nucleic acid-binding protein
LLDTSAIVEIFTHERGSRVVNEILKAALGDKLHAPHYKVSRLQAGVCETIVLARKISTVKDLTILVPLEEIMIEAPESKMQKVGSA